MGRLNTFEVFLLNQYGEVKCGSTLHGQVVLDCSHDMEVKEIVVQCYGKCHMELLDLRTSAPLVEVHTGGMIPPIVNEIYMNDMVKCFPSENGDGLSETDTSLNKILPKGSNIFDFHFDIPSNTPPSFEGDRGYIRYIIRAFVHLQNKIEYNVRNFKVLPILDLNCLLNVEAFVEEEEELEVSSLFTYHGRCHAKISLPKRGYVAGDLLHVQVDVDNATTKDITRAVLKLKMITTYKLKYQRHRSEKILAVSRLSPICAGYTFHGCDRNLRIPKDATVSHVIGCRYINVKYCVELYIRPTFLSLTSLQVTTDIEVGTVPVSPERELASLMLREPPPRYEDLPPSYHNAIKQLYKDGQINTVPEEYGTLSDGNHFPQDELSPQCDHPLSESEPFSQCECYSESGRTSQCEQLLSGSDRSSEFNDLSQSDLNMECVLTTDSNLSPEYNLPHFDYDGNHSVCLRRITSFDDVINSCHDDQTFSILCEQNEAVNMYTCHPDMLTVVFINTLDQILHVVKATKKDKNISRKAERLYKSKCLLFSRFVRLLQELSPFGGFQETSS